MTGLIKAVNQQYNLKENKLKNVINLCIQFKKKTIQFKEN